MSSEAPRFDCRSLEALILILRQKLFLPECFFHWREDVKVATSRLGAVLRTSKTCHQVSGEVSVGSVWGHAEQPPHPRRRGPTS
jgi:hypothetical protein